MGLRGPGASPIAIKPTPEVLAHRDPQPWEKKGLSRAERVAVFLETLPVTSGSQRGTNFKVRDWQWKEIIEPIYRTDADDRRFVREAVISIPRKNGKTGLVAGLAACHLVGPESVERGQVRSAANAKKQSGLIFDELSAIVNKRHWMKERINIQRFYKRMEDIGITGSTYESLAAEVHTEHGLSLSFWIYDELGQAKNRELYDVLSTSGAAWEEPLGVIISTQAAVSMHVMSELVDDGLQIKQGIVDDPSRYLCMFSAPMAADPWAEETWHACNPALGDFRNIDEMRDYAKKAKRIPAMESTFRNLYLNQRVSKDVRFIPKAVWDSCGQNPVEFDLESLRGRSCFGAWDLSGSGHNDLTSLVLVFPMEDGTKKVLPFFWASEEGLEVAEHRDRAPYRLWAKQGHLLTTPGNILSYHSIARFVAELAVKYDIQVMGIDPWNIERMIAELNAIGADLTLKKHGQYHADMEPALRAIEADVLAGRLKHPKNPVLDWCMDNVMVSSDSAGNRKFDKRKATGRIDGAVALGMAENLSEVMEPESSYSVTVI